MSTTRTSILLTGANGSLGTNTALQIAKRHPADYHLILAVRNPADVNSKNLGAALDALGNDVKYSFVAMDLTSLASVRGFVAEITKLLDSGELPALRVIINSAARVAFVAESYTADGFHPVYQVNYLSPWLLTTGLVGRLGEGGRVINVTSASRTIGRLGYFDEEGVGRGEGMTKERGAVGGLRPYASAKLMMVGFGVELRRRLVESNPSKPPPSILLYDPGAISSPSRASTYVPAPLRFVNWTLSLLAPLARLLGTQSLMEDVEVPAHALCGLACGEEFGGGRTGTWFLGDELVGRGEEVGEKEAREVWERTMGIVGGEEPAFGA